MVTCNQVKVAPNMADPTSMKHSVSTLRLKFLQAEVYRSSIMQPSGSRQVQAAYNSQDITFDVFHTSKKEICIKIK